MCGKTDILRSMPCWTPWVCHTPPKMVPPYSLGTCPPTNLETLWSPVTPSSRKNWFSEDIFFWQITQTALESPKIDICQNWPKRVLGDVIRCLGSKFDKKIPKGSVPKCQKEILMRHLLGGLSVNLNHLKTDASFSLLEHFLCPSRSYIGLRL